MQRDDYPARRGSDVGRRFKGNGRRKRLWDARWAMGRGKAAIG